jgi:hypothetical protein
MYSSRQTHTTTFYHRVPGPTSTRLQTESDWRQPVPEQRDRPTDPHAVGAVPEHQVVRLLPQRLPVSILVLKVILTGFILLIVLILYRQREEHLRDERRQRARARWRHAYRQTRVLLDRSRGEPAYRQGTLTS